MSTRSDTIRIGKEWLLSEGYQIEGKGDRLYNVTKDDDTFTVSLHQVKRKFNEYRFRHSYSQSYHEQGIKTVWVLGEQAGWNRDYFTLDTRF